MAVWLVVLITMALLIWLIAIYNGLVRLKNQCENAFSQIGVQLKRRYDLIPNLVELSSRYLKHEQDTLTAVMDARNNAVNVQGKYHDVGDAYLLGQIAEAETLLSKNLRAFNAVVENYPDLRADALIKQVMSELTDTENRIGFARQHYNDSVMFYNNQREIFPNHLLSGFFKFDKLSQLEFDEKSKSITR